jgi:fatty acid desaturase
MTLSVSPDVLSRLDQLSQRSNWRCVQALLTDYAVIAGAIYLTLGVSCWFYPISLLLIGSTQRAFTNLLHEATHTTLASTRWLNYLGGTLLSGHLVFHMFVPYKHSHIANHHPFLGNEHRDPDYRFHLECGLYRGGESMRKFAFNNVVLALLGFRSLGYMRYVARDRIFFKPQDRMIGTPLSIRAERCMLVGLWAVILTAFVWLGWLPYLIAFWFVPLLTVAIAAGWLIELAEHYPLPECERAPLLLTRNRHGWWLEQFLLGRHDDNYHLVHHLRPAIPFYNMKKAHAILLEDPAYRTWDAVWGGLFTRNRAGEETLFSYIRKYRVWRSQQQHGVPGSFALQLLRQRMPQLAALPITTPVQQHPLSLSST